VKLKSLGCGFV